MVKFAGQSCGVQRIEVIVKMQKSRGGGKVGGGGGVRVDVNELKLL